MISVLLYPILKELGYTRIFTARKVIFTMRATGIAGPRKMNRIQLSVSRRNGKTSHPISFPGE